MTTDATVEAVARAIEELLCPLDASEKRAIQYRREDARKIVRAALVALDAAGYAVVPREPTQEMIYAGDTASEYASDFLDPDGGCSHTAPQCGRAVWVAMIEAVGRTTAPKMVAVAEAASEFLDLSDPEVRRSLAPNDKERLRFALECLKVGATNEAEVIIRLVVEGENLNDQRP